VTSSSFLVLGSRGTLGSLFLKLLGERARGLDLPELDIADPAALSAAVREAGPEVVLNCAAMTDVDECERQPGKARATHRDALEVLVSESPRLVTFSTDQVFSGPRETPWLETDAPSPPNVYAATKLEGERIALGRPDSIVIRTSWLFGRDRGLVPFLAKKLAGGGVVRAVCDQTACITYAPFLASSTLGMLDDGESGLFHLVCPGSLTPFDLAVEMADGAPGMIERIRWDDLGLPARRPAYSVLGTLSEYVLPPWQDALDRWRRADE
jgi:dTDP-4-dehydrorhamnose reductase